VEAEYWGKLGPLVLAVAVADDEVIWDEHAGGMGMGVVDCDTGAGVLAAPPAAGTPLSPTLWSPGPVDGFILACKAPRLVTCDSGCRNCARWPSREQRRNLTLNYSDAAVRAQALREASE
jgi:hypothetical protein